MKKYLKLLKPALIAAGSTVVGEVVADSVSAKQLVLPNTADRVKRLVGPVAIGTVAGLAANHFFPKRALTATIVGGAASPLVMTAYKQMKSV